MKIVTLALVATTAAALGLAGTASASVVFDLTSTTVDPFNPASTVILDINDHLLGTSDTVAGANTLTVTSGASTLPSFDFQIILDYTAFGIGGFGGLGVTEILISSLSGVEGAIALDLFGNSIGTMYPTTESTIKWNVFGPALIAGGETVTIHWMSSTVPTPGAIALLGLAGCVGLSRRRKD